MNQEPKNWILTEESDLQRSHELHPGSSARLSFDFDRSWGTKLGCRPEREAQEKGTKIIPIKQNFIISINKYFF